jgi:hypothetical protein
MKIEIWELRGKKEFLFQYHKKIIIFLFLSILLILDNWEIYSKLVYKQNESIHRLIQVKLNFTIKPNKKQKYY